MTCTVETPSGLSIGKTPAGRCLDQFENLHLCTYDHGHSGNYRMFFAALQTALAEVAA